MPDNLTDRPTTKTYTGDISAALNRCRKRNARTCAREKPDAGQSPHAINISRRRVRVRRRRSRCCDFLSRKHNVASIVDRDMKTERNDLINITAIANFQP